jgi:amino acid transporter
VELGSSMPEAGGEYVYLGRGFGKAWGFLFGWTHSMLARPASVAAIAAGCIRFSSYLWPILIKPIYVVNNDPSAVSSRYFQAISLNWGHVATVMVLVLITFVNYLGVRKGGRLQVALTATKVISIFLVIGMGLLHIARLSPAPALDTKFSFQGGTFLGFWTAVAATAWAYDGWNDLNLVGSEVINPARNFRRVIISGVFFVIVVFLLFNGVCLYALPISALSSSLNPTSDVLASLSGRYAASWVTLIMAVCALGTLNSSILSGARVNYAMARDGVFFRFAGRIHPQFRTPGNALVFQCGMGGILALSGTFEDLTSLVMFANWMFYAMAVLAMMRMRHTEPELVRPYRTWGYPITPILFVIGAFALSVGLWLTRPVRSSIGLLLILAGLIPYRAWRQHTSTSPAAD